MHGVICKCYTTLYKGPEHPWIFILWRVLGWTPDTEVWLCVYGCVCSGRRVIWRRDVKESHPLGQLFHTKFLSRDQDGISCARDLLGEMPVKDKGLEARAASRYGDLKARLTPWEQRRDEKDWVGRETFRKGDWRSSQATVTHEKSPKSHGNGPAPACQWLSSRDETRPQYKWMKGWGTAGAVPQQGSMWQASLKEIWAALFKNPQSSLTPGSANSRPLAKSNLPPIFINRDLLVHSHALLFLSCLQPRVPHHAELSGCDRDYGPCSLWQ